MITPRKPLSFETFGQLVNDNFSIFAQATEMAFRMKSSKNLLTVEQDSVHPHFMLVTGEDGVSLATIKSELATMAEVLQYKDPKGYSADMNVADLGNVSWNQLTTRTALHPMLPELFRDAARLISQQYGTKVYLSELHQTVITKMKAFLTQAGHKAITDSLKECDKRAVIANELVALMHARKFLLLDVKTYPSERKHIQLISESPLP